MTTTEYIEGKLSDYDNSFVDWNAPSRFVDKVKPDDIKAFIRTLAHDLVAETRKECLREVGEMIIGDDVIAHSVLGTEMDRAFVRGMNKCKSEQRQALADLQEKMKGI